MEWWSVTVTQMALPVCCVTSLVDSVIVKIMSLAEPALSAALVSMVSPIAGVSSLTHDWQFLKYCILSS